MPLYNFIGMAVRRVGGGGGGAAIFRCYLQCPRRQGFTPVLASLVAWLPGCAGRGAFRNSFRSGASLRSVCRACALTPPSKLLVPYRNRVDRESGSLRRAPTIQIQMLRFTFTKQNLCKYNPCKVFFFYGTKLN